MLTYIEIPPPAPVDIVGERFCDVDLFRFHGITPAKRFGGPKPPNRHAVHFTNLTASLFRIMLPTRFVM